MQAWAFASYARKILGKAPAMNMLHFDRDVWVLHRRLHRRFIKFYDHIEQAIQDLEELQDSALAPPAVASANTDSQQVICLLSDSSDSNTEEEA